MGVQQTSEAARKKIPDAGEVVKSNPSKRHRDRLNGELDRLMDLLPFPEEVRSRLDKLSVLRLSVGYLRVKSYFKATMKSRNGGRLALGVNGQNGSSLDGGGLSERELLLQSLDGFVMVVTSDGLVFYVSPTIKDYLGFNQSDVVHQSVFELIHTDDRATFREQLHFALNPPPVAADEQIAQGHGATVMYNPDQLPPENSSFLERSFVCRFRCLLDNSSGFLALKFQGRLKYLHGQNLQVESGGCTRPQLALFAIAMPIQPPSIVEIRAKMLLFKTKHKLDFTPTGVDSRGKIILGYSETELCMKGSGYQFIHAADMMYCADNHIRMIKTGESGLTVFRLLSKSKGWLWVKSNAKLTYIGGRPEFIIAYQQALTNAEGEEYLRQRRLQLPFSCTTGEAILYNTGPTVDVMQFQFDKIFGDSNMEKDVLPGSLLDSFLQQDEVIYAQRVEPPLPVDQVFMDSHPLLSIASDPRQGGDAPTAETPEVKEEQQSILAVVDSLERLAQTGEFEEVLEQLQADDTAEWERALKRFNVGVDLQRTSGDILTEDIFDYIDSVFQKGEEFLSENPPSCLADSFPASELCEPLPFMAFSAGNGLPPPEQAPQERPLPAAADGLPPLQQLQLQDIFALSEGLPELAIPDISADISALQNCQQAPVRPAGRPNVGSVRVQPPDPLQSVVVTANRPQLLPHGDVPSMNFSSPNASTAPAGFPAPMQKQAAISDPLQPWTQMLPYSGTLQNGHESAALFHGSERQTFQQAAFWQTAPPGSCMMEPRFSSSPSGGDVPTHSESPQGPCRYRWRGREVGPSAVSKEGAAIHPLTVPPGAELAHNNKHYLNGMAQTKSDSLFGGPALDVTAYLE
ncbi:aryl hydrocarbon receptor-like isoform X2 [Oryzias latipes]|uniref:aryl hydrocarbon receptor-like isoform X2 n=1 Tax=Oryzias latipes TaxID=8090 RepID=UPI000CE1ECFB|nr:aryl hydrocarbon receptor-like isoform X2 [Oryzias latipes]